jgi:hypothetical protein
MQQSTTLPKLSNDKMSQVTLNKGFWFYFEHEGNDISMHGSAWTGKETVYFNNKSVSSFRNLTKLKSEHQFCESGHTYKMITHLSSIMRGTLEVCLFCDDDLLQTESVTLSPKDPDAAKGSFFVKGLWKYLLIGGLAGWLIGYFDLVNWVLGQSQ